VSSSYLNGMCDRLVLLGPMVDPRTSLTLSLKVTAPYFLHADNLEFCQREYPIHTVEAFALSTFLPNLTSASLRGPQTASLW